MLPHTTFISRLLIIILLYTDELLTFAPWLFLSVIGVAASDGLVNTMV